MIGPLPYIGGKNRLASKIISMLPEHITYVEPLARGAQGFFHKAPSNVEVLNHLDFQIVNFYRVCQWHHDEFLRYLRFRRTSPKLQRLKRYDRPTTCFYLAPPYWRRKLYKFNFSDADFQNLDQHLRALKGRFILSLDDPPEVRKLFDRWNLVPVDIAYPAKRDATIR